MKKLLIALAFLPFAAGIASAGEALTDQQMDRVTAGGGFIIAIIGRPVVLTVFQDFSSFDGYSRSVLIVRAFHI